jgi:hypothetical protein
MKKKQRKVNLFKWAADFFGGKYLYMANNKSFINKKHTLNKACFFSRM